MATIRKRANSLWQAIIRRSGWPNQSKVFKTKYEADRWARSVESEMDRGIFVSRHESESTTLNEALDRYSREVSSRKKGHKRESDRIKAWQSSELASRFLATLRGSDFAEYRDERRAENCAENTIRIELALISHLFTVAQREWGMEGLNNPIKSIAMPSGSKQRTRRLIGNEEMLLVADLKTCRNPYIVQVVIFAIETGCRQSEILKLTWEDINFSEKVAHLKNTKNGESRSIPLSPKAIEAIKAQPRAIIKSTPIFIVSADGLSRAFKRSCEKIGLQDLRFHDLRHEATSRLFEMGLNPIEAAAITGHKTLQMLKRYTHLKPADLAKKLGWS